MDRYCSVLSIFICLWITVYGLVDRGAISVSGAPSTWSPHIAGGNCGVTVSGASVTLSQSCAPRVYMMQDSTHFAKFPSMLGKSIKFTVNLASSTCGCNAAVYFIKPPSYVTGGDSYCDAQCPSGTNMLGCCEEIDIFEANTHAFQATAHCSGSNNNACQWGCGVNWKSGNGYGPGASKINTNNEFTCKMDFIRPGSSLTAIRVTLTQGTNSLSYTLTDSTCSLKSNYITGLSSAIASGNLVMAISYWGGDMNWLDGCSAGGQCSSSSSVTFKNFVIGTAPSSLTEDDDAMSSGFVGTPGFYAVIGISVLIVLLVVVAVVVTVKRRNTTENV